MEFVFGALGLLVVAGALTTVVALFLRRVVPTNEVHIVQSGKKTTSYGKDTGNGNTYYQWPSFLPVIGITRSIFPVSIFDLELSGYEAYDKGRLPFIVDVTAFFQITNSDIAAQRVSSFTELREQLLTVVQGSVRTILASSEIEEIMQGRSKFGNEFTQEVKEQLAAWGVEPVKNLELMDIRDANNSIVIKNIMEKKKSLIEMESRSEVAKNRKTAEMAEIEAKKEIDLNAQSAAQAVGLRKTETERQVSLAQQEAVQVIKQQEKLTKEKEMEVLKVQEVRKAEIIREVQVVQAEQAKQTDIIKAEALKNTSVTMAEGEKQKTTLIAEGKLEAKRREADGIAAEGKALADAKTAMELAPVTAQVTLAKEIGANESYQKYLITIRQVEANQAIGEAQAAALEHAEIKVIANSGNVSNGINSLTDIISSKGGVEMGAMLEGFANTDTGKALLTTLGVNTESNKPTPKSNVILNGNGSSSKVKYDASANKG